MDSTDDSTEGSETRTQLLLAEWVLGRLAPEDVPALAVEALQGGCGASVVAVLAGLQRPTRAEIETELPDLLKALALPRPSRTEALKLLVDDVAARVVGGGIPARLGAQQIHSLWRWEFDARSDPEIWLDVGALVGWQAETENGPASMDVASIGDWARALLDRGGLNITSRIGQGQLEGCALARCHVQEHVLDGKHTTVRLALEFADGLYLTFGAAPDAASLELGFRPVRAFDLGEHGSVVVRSDGYPCDVLVPGASIRTVTALAAPSGATVGVRIDTPEAPVYVHLLGENVAVVPELPGDWVPPHDG